MSSPSGSAEPVALVVPLTPAALPRARAELPRWADGLKSLPPGSELVVVAPAEPPDWLPAFLEARPAARLIPLPGAEVGFGAAIRAALPTVAAPLVLTVGLDYPYTPADIKPMLERMRQLDPVANQYPAIVAGCRAGRRAPPAWRILSGGARLFARVALGFAIEPSPGWHGLRGVGRSWLAWALFGDPYRDTDCALRLVRAAGLREFPIQSDGGFVHAEVAAKLTFLTRVLDEVVLTPSDAPAPACDWRGFWPVLGDPKFTLRLPPKPEPTSETSHEPRSTNHELPVPGG